MAKYSAKRRKGNMGEEIACQYLERHGYTIVERNYLQRWGEIDIVALLGDVVHIVEVKAISRENPSKSDKDLPYLPEESVTREKLRKLARTASLYMDSRRDTREYQIDVIGVLMDMSTRRAVCRIFPQAITDNF